MEKCCLKLVIPGTRTMENNPLEHEIVQEQNALHIQLPYLRIISHTKEFLC